MSSAGDPIRFRDSALGEQKPLAELFRAAEEDLPDSRQLESLAARLGPVLDAAPAAKATPHAFSKLGALGGIAAVLAIAAGYLVSRTPAHVEPTHAPVPQSAPPVQSQPTPEVQPQPSAAAAPAPVPTIEAQPAPSAAKSAPAKPDEAALLEQARRALVTDPQRALAITRRHQALYPHGVLVQEREVIAIEALRRLGREGQASDRANSFEKSYPDSAHRRAVEKGLGP